MILASTIDAFCRNFGKAMVIDTGTIPLAAPSTASSSAIEETPVKGKGKDVKKARPTPFISS
jgi:hypothetical protein